MITVQDLYNKFKFKVGNRNLLEDDFIGLVNSSLNKLSFIGQNVLKFRTLFLEKEKKIEIKNNDNGYYVELSQFGDNSQYENPIWIEAEKNRQDGKVYINTDLLKDPNYITYITPLKNISNITDTIDLQIYEEVLLYLIISNYYETRSDSIELSQYYNNIALSLLQM